MPNRSADGRISPIAADPTNYCTATVNNVTIRYTDSGGQGITVILNHGFAMDHSMFAVQVAALVPQYRVVTWDQRGWGATRATGAFTLWDSARDGLALLDHLGVGEFVCGGMSQGGFVALRMALLAPKRVSALVLLSTQAGAEDRSGPDRLIAEWTRCGSVAVQDRLAQTLLGPGDWSGWYAKWADITTNQLAWAYDAMIDRDDLTECLPEISCPALVVHGTSDVAVPLALGEVLARHLGGQTTLVVINGGAHAANITHADEVNAALRHFLDQLNRQQSRSTIPC